MSTNSSRRTLAIKIQRQLSSLSTSQLRVIIRSIDDGNLATNIEELSDIDLYERVIDYVRGDQLQSLEDEGMAQLLLLDDLITDLLQPTGDTLAGVEKSAHLSMGDPAVSPIELPVSADRDSDLLLKRPKSPAQTAGTIGLASGAVSPSSSLRKHVVSIGDVTSLLPRREFKLHGGQISDTSSDISYSNLCKQIDEGLQEGFTESEVIRSVLKTTKPGTFREMLINRSDLNVDELKKFLRSHIRDKNSTELFQELTNAKQSDRESPQQFLYRVMGLKQRVLSESQVGTGFNYDVKLVQGTFLHTLYQGLNEKNDYVRRDLKPYLKDMQIGDDFLLEQMTKSTSEEAERHKRLGLTAKIKTVTVATVDSSDKTNTKVDPALQIQQDAIRELTLQVSSLTDRLAQITRPPDNTISVDPSPPRHSSSVQVGTRGRCSSCVQRNNVTCQHCFACGQAGHRAIGCLQRRLSGNVRRSLEGGSQ